MSFVKRWILESPYAAELGVELESLATGRARLRLPFQEGNSNPGGVLHGGCAASLAAIGAQTVTRATLGEDAAPWHTVGLQVNYLAAAARQAVVAEATLLRRGKALCFVEVSVETEDAKPIAHATTVARARFGAGPSGLGAVHDDPGGAEPGPMGPLIARIPFMERVGVGVEHMAGGRSRLVLPWKPDNADEAGGVHEGAVLALLDTTGAMASWSLAGYGPHKASTPSVQAQILAPPPQDDLVAWGRTAQRDGEIFWSDVEIAGASDRRIFARGTVIYRIVITPKQAEEGEG
jgi:uncharacterized protein (TIGR00369 family)